MSGPRSIKVKQVIEVVETEDTVEAIPEPTTQPVAQPKQLSIRQIAWLTTGFAVIALVLYVLL